MNLWKESAQYFKNPKAVVAAGMLLALHVVLGIFVTIPLTDSVRISISFITNVVTGYLFGPWMAMVSGALGDILQFIIKPTGTYFFGWTLNAAIAGIIYGIAFYRKAPESTGKGSIVSKIAFLLRCILAMAFVAVMIQMFMGTFWCCIMYGKGFWFYFSQRAVKSLIQLPFNVVLVYFCLQAVKQLHVKRAAGLSD